MSRISESGQNGTHYVPPPPQGALTPSQLQQLATSMIAKPGQGTTNFLYAFTLRKDGTASVQTDLVFSPRVVSEYACQFIGYGLSGGPRSEWHPLAHVGWDNGACRFTTSFRFNNVDTLKAYLSSIKGSLSDKACNSAIHIRLDFDAEDPTTNIQIVLTMPGAEAVTPGAQQSQDTLTWALARTPGSANAIDVEGTMSSIASDASLNADSPCEKTVQKLKKMCFAKDDPAEGFLKTQTCIAEKACAAESQMSHPNWLNSVIPDFVNPFLAESGSWKAIIAECRSRSAWNPMRLSLCEREMAEYHMSNDLQNALNRDGCGEPNDWDTVGDIISECISENLTYWQSPTKLGVVPYVLYFRNKIRYECTQYRLGNGLNPVY